MSFCLLEGMLIVCKVMVFSNPSAGLYTEPVRSSFKEKPSNQRRFTLLLHIAIGFISLTRT
jgi:hypothetical protein